MGTSGRGRQLAFMLAVNLNGAEKYSIENQTPKAAAPKAITKAPVTDVSVI